MRKSLSIVALLFVSIGAPNVHAGSKLIPVYVTGGAEACVYNFPGPPRYICAAGSLNGTLTFDSLTNSIVGPWSIDWDSLERFSGDGSIPISGSALASDTFYLDGLVFSDLGLAEFPCPVGNGGDFCRSHGELIPVATVEPSSIVLFGTSVLGLVPFRRKTVRKITPSIKLRD
jgi:hypothetical protein